jgi:ribosomal protein L18
MKTIKIVDDSGNHTIAYTPENEAEFREQVAKDKKQNIKEHLYIGYLIVGTIAFTIGIFVSLKRLKGN